MQSAEDETQLRRHNLRWLWGLRLAAVLLAIRVVCVFAYWGRWIAIRQQATQEARQVAEAANPHKGLVRFHDDHPARKTLKLQLGGTAGIDAILRARQGLCVQRDRFLDMPGVAASLHNLDTVIAAIDRLLADRTTAQVARERARTSL